MIAPSYNECFTATREFLKSVGDQGENPQFQLLDFQVKPSSDSALGLVGASKKLHVTVQINDEHKKVQFFLKTKPDSPTHCSYVEAIGCFKKETDFYAMSHHFGKYMIHKSVPNCYFADDVKGFVVLEDLSLLGYRNAPLHETFTKEECEAGLRSLADFQAASMIHEGKEGQTLDQLYPNSTYVSFYNDSETHPGNKHMRTGINALLSIFKKYKHEEYETLEERIREMFTSVPQLLLPSQTHRNGLCHTDLWCNNIMFQYSSANQVENSIIIDFQGFGYNPPVLDALSMVYMNTSRNMRAQYLSHLINHYYNSFCQTMKSNGEDPSEYLNVGEFTSSIQEMLPLALALTPLYLHYVLIPEDKLAHIMTDKTQFTRFMGCDRAQIITDCMETVKTYRARLLESFDDIVEYLTENNEEKWRVNS